MQKTNKVLNLVVLATLILGFGLSSRFYKRNLKKEVKHPIALQECIRLLAYYSDKAVEAWKKMKTCNQGDACYKKQQKIRKKYVKAFYKILPDDFKTFFQIYGDYDKDYVYSRNPWGKYYPGDESKPHQENPGCITHLWPEDFAQGIYPVEAYYEKLISIGIGGCYGGASEVIARVLYELIFQRMVLAASILEKKTDDEIASLFYFLHDGPHPDHPLIQRDYEVLYDQLLVINERLAGLLKKGYDQLLSEDHCEGH